MKQFVRWAVVTVMAVPAAVVCSQTTPGVDATADRSSTTRPAMMPRMDRGPGLGGPRDGGPSRGDGGGPGRRWGGYRDGGPPTPEEWADVEQFMRTNSPVRIEMLKKIEDDLGPDRPISQVVRGRLIQRFRDLERKRNDNADMYAFAVKQLQAEDAVLGVLRDERRPSADVAALDKKLDEQVRAFVDNNLAERQARIDRLKQILDAQSQSLQKDRGSIDDFVIAQRDKFKKEMDGMLNFNPKDDNATTQPAVKGPKV